LLNAGANTIPGFHSGDDNVKNQILPVLLVLTVSALIARADQVTLQNGDRVSGTITKSDGKTVVLKTDYAGEITIQYPSIKEIHTDQTMHVEFSGGKTAVGPVSTSDSQVTVASTTGAPVTESASSLVTMRNPDEQAAYEKSLHPPLTRGWIGGLNFGFGLTGGNSQTASFNLAFNADRKTTTDETTAYATSVYSTNNAPGAVPSTTANTIQAGVRYSHNLTKRIFVFGNADFQTDALQDLNLRSIFGGGLGYHVINTDKTTFDVLGGLNYTNENYTTITNHYIALTAGEELTRKLGASTVITEKGYIFPVLNDWGQYRATFNFGTVTKINNWLGWQNAFGDIYVTNPPVGTKRNDIVLTTGLNIAFTH
jgi:putative salt-induced outer membrane protein YdiY